MIRIYGLLMKLLNLFINLIFIIQIVLMATIFLTAAYWFFNLIKLNLFNFAEPLASWVTGLVKAVYGQEVILSNTNIDGTLLFFDIIALIAAFLITMFKGMLYKLIDRIDHAMSVKKKTSEQKMNKKLEEQAIDLIKNYNKAVVIIEFNAQNTQVDKFWGGDPEKDVEENTEEAVKTLYGQVKSLYDCAFVRTNNRVVVVVNNFDRVDKVLLYVEDAVAEIKNNMARNHWKLTSYIAVDAFHDKANFKHNIYPSMDKLLRLRQKNEIVCYGNFSLRHNLLPKPIYYLVLLKGDYAMEKEFENHTIYTLVKKSKSAC